MRRDVFLCYSPDINGPMFTDVFVNCCVYYFSVCRLCMYLGLLLYSVLAPRRGPLVLYLYQKPGALLQLIY